VIHAPEVVAYLAAINLLAFFLFRQDKRAAIAGARRVPERTLLGLAAIGGGLGAVAAQRMLRHKTRKEPFRTLLYLIVAAQLVAVVVVLSVARR
jgi:uncharacterized membrane protein YsdA (DUF1294 family)